MAKKFLQIKLKETECCSFPVFNSICLGLLGVNLLFIDVGQVDGIFRSVFKMLYRPGRENTEGTQNTGELIKLSDLYDNISSEEVFP